MTTFDSLTLALENWFVTPLSELPDALRRRVEKEFDPMPWEQLSAEQRRTVALQMDYQNDPATEQDQQFWWDHYWRQDELKAQIAQWEATAAPTAGELALRETRLKELRQELARMALQERQARGDYHPERKPLDGASEKSPASQRSALQYVAYPKAMAQLRKRLDATPEELAAWIWDGPKDGGIAAYVNANELDRPPRFYFALGSGRGDDHDYVSPLMACWFREDELAEFNPADRYITGEALIKRWAERPGLKAEAWVLAKIRESRLSDLHPLYGGTQGTWPENESLPPMTTGLFRLSDVEEIEAEDFADDPSASDGASPATPTEEGIAAGVDTLPAAVSEAGGSTPSIPIVATGLPSDRAIEQPAGIDQGSKSTEEAGIVSNETTSSATAIVKPSVGSPAWRKENARRAANSKHDRPGGSRDLQRQIREVWASGKYSSRDTCADQECAALGISFSTARRALNNTPEPNRG